MITLEQLRNDEEFRRSEFPICARKIYCAHASDGPLPRRVAEAMRRSIDRASQEEHLHEDAIDELEQMRAKIASFVGATPEEISFTGPTSSGLSTIANGLDWRQGDEVVCYFEDYPANVYPWLALRDRGVKVVFLQPRRLGEITPAVVAAALSSKTRLVALASAHNCSGFRLDLKEIGAVCAEQGAFFCVDAIQTLGAFPLDLEHVDFFSAGAQKWVLGPAGAGILFVKQKHHGILRPAVIGGWNVESPNHIAQSDVRFAGGGRKFEAGSYSFAAIAGMHAAFGLLAEIGQAKVAKTLLELTRIVQERLSDFVFLGVDSERNQSGILSCYHPDISSEKLVEALRRENIVTSLRFDRPGNGYLRISPHCYNTPAEMERLTEVLNEIAPRGARRQSSTATSSAAPSGCV